LACCCWLEKGQHISRKDITRRLVEILYERNDTDFRRGTFRVRGDVIEVLPYLRRERYRIELFATRSTLFHKLTRSSAP